MRAARTAPAGRHGGAPARRERAARTLLSDEVVRYVRDTPLELGHRVWQLRPPTPSLTVVVKGTFRLREGAPAAFAEEQAPATGEIYYEDDVRHGVRWPSDFALLKPRGECLLVGTVRTPGGRPTPALSASFRVGPIRRELAIFGDRAWRRGLVDRLAEPAPFTEMELRPERAFGGPTHPDNPLGRGIEPTDVDGERRHLAPNLEDPSALIGARSSRPAPMLVGPRPSVDPARRRYAGTYDAAYMRDRWPYLPADFDWRYFLDAPPTQRLGKGFFRGDEAVEVRGLFSEQPAVRSRLPRIAPRVFLDLQPPGEDARFVEVPTKLDTVVLDASSETVRCVWRGSVEIPSERLDEILPHVYAAHEPLDEPRPAAEHEARLRAILAAERDEEDEAEGEDPPAIDAPTRTDGSATDSSATDDASTAGSATDGAATDGAATDPVEARGSTAHEVPAREPASDEPASGPAADAPATDGAATSDATTSDAATSDAATSDAAVDDGALADAESELEAQMAALRARMDAMGSKPPEPAAAEPPSPSDLRARLAALREQPGLAPELVEGLEAMLDDLEAGDDEEPAFDDDETVPDPPPESARPTPRQVVEARLAAEEPLRDLDLAHGDLAGLDLSGQDLRGSILARVSLAGAKLVGACLAGVSLRESELVRADLSGADLREAALDGASLQWAVARGADLTDADLDGARLYEADLREVCLRGATLREACLERTWLARADLVTADLEGANLRGADATGADLTDATLEEASLDGARLPGATLVRVRGEGLSAKGASFVGAVGPGSFWERAALDEADFSRSHLDGADFSDAVLTRACFDECLLVEARFDRARGPWMRARKANLFEACLLEAELPAADLRSSNLFGAELHRARVADARLAGANLTRTTLEG